MKCELIKKVKKGELRRPMFKRRYQCQKLVKCKITEQNKTVDELYPFLIVKLRSLLKALSSFFFSLTEQSPFPVVSVELITAYV